MGGRCPHLRQTGSPPGAFAYSRWRMLLVSLMLGSASLATGGWQTLTQSALLLALSGLIGIFVGDTALFACMNRLGPRRSGLLFSCHALFSALLGLWLFGEQLGGWRLVGAMLVFAGVMLAILLGRRGNAQQSEWEQVRGHLVIGIGLGLTAAFCQSLGAIIAKPVMMSGTVDAISASGIRMGSALLAHCTLRALRVPLSLPHNPINRQVLGMIGINGFLAMAMGMTLILVALRQGTSAWWRSSPPPHRSSCCHCCGGTRAAPFLAAGRRPAGDPGHHAGAGSQRTLTPAGSEPGDLVGGQLAIFARCQLFIQRQVAHPLPVQSHHLVADGRKHPLHLMVLALVDGQTRLALSQDLQLGRVFSVSLRSNTPSANNAMASGLTGSASQTW